MLILMVFTQMIYYLMPIQAKLEMNQICRQYALTCEIQNGLTTQQINQMMEQLKHLGLREVQVTAPQLGHLDLGEKTELIVKAEFDSPEVSERFISRLVNRVFEYRISIYGRKVIN